MSETLEKTEESQRQKLRKVFKSLHQQGHSGSEITDYVTVGEQRGQQVAFTIPRTSPMDGSTDANHQTSIRRARRRAVSWWETQHNGCELLRPSGSEEQEQQTIVSFSRHHQSCSLSCPVLSADALQTPHLDPVLKNRASFNHRY